MCVRPVTGVDEISLSCSWIAQSDQAQNHHFGNSTTATDTCPEAYFLPKLLQKPVNIVEALTSELMAETHQYHDSELLLELVSFLPAKYVGVLPVP